MKRRTLLAALSAGIGTLAGCSGRFGSQEETPTNSDTPTETPADTPTQTPEQNGDGDFDWDLGQTSIVDLETANRTYALAPLRYRSDDGGRVQLRFASTASPDSPATVEATLTNENRFENTFSLEWTPPFGRLVSDNPTPMGEQSGEFTYRAALVFAPTENHELVENPPEIRRGADGYWRLDRDTVPDFPEQVRLEPGETVYGEYALVGRMEGSGTGRPTGVYEFSRAKDSPVRITVWKTDAPGPTTDSRFAGTSLPALPRDSDTAWFHEADAGTPTFVRPSVEATELPAGVEFTFVNRSRQSTSCGHWQLYKLQDGEWFSLGPYIQTADCRVVRPGDTKTWTMRAANGEMAPGEARSFEFLGGGRYAAVAGYGHATPRSGALVEFDAPPVSVTPSENVTTEREDGTVTATSQRWKSAPDEENRSRIHLVLERTEDADRRFIAEQVMRRRFRGLRNTLAFAEPDVERVVLRTDDRVADGTVGHDTGSLRFQYDGQAYVLTKSSQ